MKFKVKSVVEFDYLIEGGGELVPAFKLYAQHEPEKGDTESFEEWVEVGTFRTEESYRHAAEVYKKIKSNPDTFFDVL